MADSHDSPQTPDEPDRSTDPAAPVPPVPSPGTPAAPSSGTDPAGHAGVPVPGTAYSGDSRKAYSPPPDRTSAQIRADIEAQRNDLGQSVDSLREKVTELTDWRGQIRKHRKQIIIGAVATGFVVGGLMALRRR